MLAICLFLPFGYLAGSIPSAVLIGRAVKGIDIRTLGSGNAGTTNTIRILGLRWGIVVFMIDFLKGFLPVLLARIFGPELGAQWTLLCLGTGVLAMLGHVFPVFASFRGGKGIATGAGFLFALFPESLAVCLAVFLLTLVLSGFVSLSSMLAAISLPFWVALLELPEIQHEGFAPGLLTLVFIIVLPIAVVLLHGKNIRRLFKGTENRFERIWILGRILKKTPLSQKK